MLPFVDYFCVTEDTEVYVGPDVSIGDKANFSRENISFIGTDPGRLFDRVEGLQSQWYL